MNSYTIHCIGCGAIRSFERSADDAQLTYADVLAQAPHSGGHHMADSSDRTVSIDASNAANILYSIS